MQAKLNQSFEIKLNTLVLATHGIGDLIMLLPAIKYIDKSNSFMTILLNSKLEKELFVSAFQDKSIKIYLLSEYQGFFMKFLLLYKLRRVNYDKIIPQASLSKEKVLILSIFMKSSLLCAFKNYFRKNEKEQFMHKVEVNMSRLVSEIQYKSVRMRMSYPDLLFSPDAKKLVNNYIDDKVGDNNILIIGPGSYEAEKHKRLPISYYSPFLKRVFNTFNNITVLIVGSKDEEGIANEIIDDSSSIHGSIYSVAGLFSLMESIYLISKSKVVVANCNAVSHFSALVGVPVVGLYGPTNYKFTGPFLTDLYPVSAKTNCSPCYHKKSSGCGNPICMSEIKPSDIFHQVSKCL